MVQGITEIGEREPSLVSPEHPFVDRPILNDPEQTRLLRFSELLLDMGDQQHELGERIHELTPHLNRDQRRSIEQFSGTGLKYQDFLSSYALNAALCCVVQRRNDGVELDVHAEAMHVANVLVPRRLMNFMSNSAGLGEVVKNAAEQRIRHVDEVFTLVLPPTPEVQGIDGPDSDYKFVRQFMYASQFPDDERALDYSTMLVLAEQASPEHGRLIRTSEALVGGEYNDLLFQDLLTFVFYLDEGEVPRSLVSAWDQTKLIRSCSDLNDAELLDRMLANKELFHPTVRLELEREIERFTQSINRYSRDLNSALSENNLSILDAQTMMERTHIFLHALPAASTPEVTEVEQIVAAARMLGVGRAPSVMIGVIEASTEDLPEREPYKLSLSSSEPLDLDDQNVLQQQLGRELGKLVYVSGFMNDLCALLRHLSTVDFSRGVFQGIKKYGSYSLRGNNAASVDVYGYKPVDSKVPMKTKAAKNLRVLFHFENDEIRLLKVGERSEMNKYLSANGMGKSRRKSRRD